MSTKDDQERLQLPKAGTGYSDSRSDIDLEDNDAANGSYIWSSESDDLAYGGFADDEDDDPDPPYGMSNSRKAGVEDLDSPLMYDSRKTETGISMPPRNRSFEKESESDFLSGTLRFSHNKFFQLFSSHRPGSEPITANPVLIETSTVRSRTTPRSGAGRARANLRTSGVTRIHPPDQNLDPGRRERLRYDSSITAGINGHVGRENLLGGQFQFTNLPSSTPGMDDATPPIAQVPIVASHGPTMVPVTFIQQHRYVELEGVGLGYLAPGPDGTPVWVSVPEKVKGLVVEDGQGKHGRGSINPERG